MTVGAGDVAAGAAGIRDPSAESLKEFLVQAAELAAERFLHAPEGTLLPAATQEEIRACFDEELPEQPLDPQALLDRVRRQVFPHSVTSTSPRFLSLVTGAGNPFALAAEGLAAALNPVVAREVVAPAATAVERQVVRWIGRFLGYADDAAGLLVSGGSMANLAGLMAARTRRLPEATADGLTGGPRPTFYASTEAHLCLEKSVDLMGAGRRALRLVPVGPDFRIDMGALERAVADDVAAGHVPVAVVGQGGAVNTGAVDPLDRLADFCAERGLWLHVDGAYGGPAAGTDVAGEMFAGLERVDSIAVDAHKWFQVPFTAGCVLVRDRSALHGAFSLMADYAESSRDRDDQLNLMELGFQMSRSFSALKVWMTFLGYGAAALRATVEENIATARRFGRRLEQSGDFEVLAPPVLSVLCFRYVGDGGRDEEALDAFNRRLFEALEADGRFLLGRVRIAGRVALRLCIIKYRTDDRTMDELLDVLRQITADLEDA